MKKSILLVITCFSLAVMSVSCEDNNKEVKVEIHEEYGSEKRDLAYHDVYQCPMNCEKGKTYDKEGTCPVCKMNLQKVKKEADHTGHDH